VNLKKRGWAFLFLFFHFSLGSVLQAQQAAFPSLDPDPRAAAYAQKAAAEGPGWELLAEASLWASGADPDAPVGRGKPSYMETIRVAVDELVHAPDLPREERERGEYVLAFMFAKFLKGYSEKQTRIDTLLSGGIYNCVSSAVLYAVLTAAAGLRVQGVVTKDHAFVTLTAGGETVDVETTNPYGFDPGNRKDFHDGFGNTTGFVYVPAGNYRDRTAVNSLELVSLIFNNRITEAETQRRYADAVALAVNRAGLLSGPTETTYSRFFAEPEAMALNCLLNYGASLLNGGREEAALEWAEIAASRYPDGNRWPDFTKAALNNLLVKLIRAGRLGEARTTLNGNVSRIRAGDYGEFDAMLAAAELAEKAQAIKTPEDADAVLVGLDNAPPGIEAGRIREMRVYSLLKKAEFIAKEDGWKTAIAFAEAASAEYPDSRFGEFLRAARTNRVADLHNSFADAYNSGDLDAAITIIEEALREFPANRQLLEDKRLAEKRR
jgi:tetratricopeptide (TPR) repeat protein